MPLDTRSRITAWISDVPKGLIHKALIATPDSPAVLDSLGGCAFVMATLRVQSLIWNTLIRSSTMQTSRRIGVKRCGLVASTRRHDVFWAAAIARAPDAPLLKATMARFLKDAP